MDELTGLQRADAAIVGAGLTGLLTGARLAHGGMQVVLVDSGDGEVPPCSAAATLMNPSAWERLAAARDMEAAGMHMLALQGQLQAMLTSPPPYVQETSAFLYARGPSECPVLENHLTLLEQLHLPATISPDAGGCPFPVDMSLMLHAQAAVDLPAWMAALRRTIMHKGGRIFLRSRVIGLDSQRVCTAKGCVDAPMIILCCGKPLGLRAREMLALLESRMQMLCTMTGSYPVHAVQIPAAPQGLTLCPAAGGITVSQDGLRCGERGQALLPARLEHQLAERLPDWRPGMLHQYTSVESMDGLPFIGLLPGTRHLFAAGYGAFGVLGAMHAAEVLTRRILAHPAPQDRLYAPDREIPSSVLKAARKRFQGLYWGNAWRRNAPACAHCGGRMRYLPAFQRWDCPCCGSAYTMLGMPIRSPGMRPARVSVRQRPDV